MTARSADLEWGNFSENGPWVLDRDAIAWSKVADVLREAAQREVPTLIRARRLPPIGRLVVVTSRLGWALLPWFISKKRGKFATPEASRADVSVRLRHAIEHLGATYIKLAQIISSGEGLFPTELVDEFKKCRDQVPPQPWDTVRTIVEQDLGARLSDVFSSFEQTSLEQISQAPIWQAQTSRVQ